MLKSLSLFVECCRDIASSSSVHLFVARSRTRRARQWNRLWQLGWWCGKGEIEDMITVVETLVYSVTVRSYSLCVTSEWSRLYLHSSSKQKKVNVARLSVWRLSSRVLTSLVTCPDASRRVSWHLSSRALTSHVAYSDISFRVSWRLQSLILTSVRTLLDISSRIWCPSWRCLTTFIARPYVCCGALYAYGLSLSCWIWMRLATC